MNRKGTWMGCLLILGFFLPSTAQPVLIHSELDKKEIMIGDQIHLQWKVTFDPQKYFVQWPSIPDTINHFECIAKGKRDTIEDRHQTLLRQDITWTHFDSGAWVLPAMPFHIQPKNGDSSYVQWTDSFTVKVNTPIVDTSKPFMPLMDIKEVKKPLTDYVKWIGLGLILLMLLTLVVWYLVRWNKKRKQEKLKKPAAILLTPSEEALKELQLIELEAGFLHGQEKKYHTDMTDVLRRYLQQQFGLDCFEKTSTEIMQSVKKQKALANCRQSLRHVLETADMVKFAKGTLTPEEHLHSLALSREVVNESYRKFQQQITTETVKP